LYPAGQTGLIAVTLLVIFPLIQISVISFGIEVFLGVGETVDGFGVGFGEVVEALGVGETVDGFGVGFGEVVEALGVGVSFVSGFSDSVGLGDGTGFNVGVGVGVGEGVEVGATPPRFPKLIILVLA
jgi:hypothetical protein